MGHRRRDLDSEPAVTRNQRLMMWIGGAAAAAQSHAPPELALDEANAALALSNGTAPRDDATTAFDRAHDDVVALVRDYAQGKAHPPATAVPDGAGAPAEGADTTATVVGDSNAGTGGVGT